MSDDLRRIGISVRKRAPFTGSSFDFIRVKIHCAKCEKQGLQPLAELEVNDDADCPFCGSSIDLSAPAIREEISEAAEEHKQIKIIKLG